MSSKEYVSTKEFLCKQTLIGRFLNLRFKQTELNKFNLSEIIKIIKETPATEVQEKRYGRWVEMKGPLPPEYRKKHFCSCCETMALNFKGLREELSNFCPNCGVEMLQ